MTTLALLATQLIVWGVLLLGLAFLVLAACTRAVTWLRALSTGRGRSTSSPAPDRRIPSHHRGGSR